MLTLQVSRACAHTHVKTRTNFEILTQLACLAVFASVLHILFSRARTQPQARTLHTHKHKHKHKHTHTHTHTHTHSLVLSLAVFTLDLRVPLTFTHAHLTRTPTRHTSHAHTHTHTLSLSLISEISLFLHVISASLALSVARSFSTRRRAASSSSDRHVTRDAASRMTSLRDAESHVTSLPAASGPDVSAISSVASESGEPLCKVRVCEPGMRADRSVRQEQQVPNQPRQMVKKATRCKKFGERWKRNNYPADAGPEVRELHLRLSRVVPSISGENGDLFFNGVKSPKFNKKKLDK